MTWTHEHSWKLEASPARVFAALTAVLVGDRLRGAAGAIAAVTAICLPGALLMFGAGVAYGVHGDRPVVTAILHGVAAAATGLVFALTMQLGRKSLASAPDLVFVVATAAAIDLFHLRVPYVLLVMGAIAIWWHRPRTATAAVTEQ